MPVQKFRTLDEARESLWSVGGSDQNVRRLRFALAFWSRVRPRSPRRGVTKFHSIEEANQARDAWEAGGGK